MHITRKHNWAEEMHTYIESIKKECIGLSFEAQDLNKLDCVRLCNGHIKVITGFDLLKHYGIKYYTQMEALKEAAKCHKNFGLYFWELPKLLFESVPQVFVSMGDIVVFDERPEEPESDLHRFIFGVCLGENVLVITKEGIGFKNLNDSKFKVAYRI